MDKYEKKFLEKYEDPTLELDLDQLDIFNDLYTTISAINNKNRLKILFIIAKENKNGSSDLNASKIRKILLSKGNTTISPQAVGIFLKKLVDANLIKKIEKKKIGEPDLTVYKINPMGINRIFLELGNLREDLMDDIFNCQIKDFNREHQCILTVIDGVDAGKSFLLNCDDGNVRIGRRGNLDENELDYQNDIILSNEYEAVTKVSKPHAILKFEKGRWLIFEGNSTNGTYINNSILKVSYTHLNNRDIIKLAQGEKGVSLLCSLN